MARAMLLLQINSIPINFLSMIGLYMKMQEMTESEVMIVSGGDRALGSLYQYTGDDGDRTVGEYIKDKLFKAFDFVFGELY